MSSSRFPMSMENIFEVIDIPENFINEKSNGIFFSKLMEFLENEERDEINDSKQCFLIHHLMTRMVLEMNYLCAAAEDTLLKTPEGKDSVLQGIFSIIYSAWDYSFSDPNVGIESGKERLSQYFTDEFYNSLPEDQKFIKVWVNQKLNKDRILKMLDYRKKPFNNDFSNISETDQMVIKIIRDAQEYGPFYSIYFYPETGQKFLLYELIISLLTQYQKVTFDDFEESLRMFYQSSNRHEPYTDFTKKLIQLHNDISKESDDKFLNNHVSELYHKVTDSTNFNELVEKFKGLPKSGFPEFTENSPLF